MVVPGYKITQHHISEEHNPVFLRLMTLSVSQICAAEWQMIGEKSIGEDVQGSGHGLIRVLSWHLPGGFEENDKNFLSS
jgi:hypothetical protein